MNVLSFVGWTGYVIGLLSAIFAFQNRTRYTTLINDIYEPGNKELREQITALRTERIENKQLISTLEAQNSEKDKRVKDLKELNSNQPNYVALAQKTTELINTMSNNHKEVMQSLTNLSGKLVK